MAVVSVRRKRGFTRDRAWAAIGLYMYARPPKFACDATATWDGSMARAVWRESTPRRAWLGLFE